MYNFTFKPKSGRNFIFTGILAMLIVFVTLGLATPWAVVMIHQWRADHTMIDGRQVRFYGTGSELFGKWILWFFLTIITFGLFSLVWYPRYQKWIVERTGFAVQ